MLKASAIDPVVTAALREDVGTKDLTTSTLIAPSLAIKADILFKQRAVLCGIEIAERVFRLLDESVRFLPVAKDGEWVEAGREVAYLEGPAASILIGERTALNFLGWLSGIATVTRQFVERVKGTEAQILDTRKTTPTLRRFEKYAVRTGGGVNHRQGLYDEVLIKDNHLLVLRKRGIVEIVDEVRRAVLKKTVVGIEVANLKELREALKSRADYILLDNMTPETVAEAVAMRRKGGHVTPFEVSGGISLENVSEYARAGVERISIGGLTHSADFVDVSLNIVA